MRVLVTGASGQLGGYLLRELSRSGVEIVAWSGSRSGRLGGVALEPVDLADAEAVAAAFSLAHPAVLIHAGAMAGVGDCQRNPERAAQVNVRGTAVLVELAAGSAARFVYVSTDLVFDGEKGWYREQDPTAPLSTYGRTKVEAERAVLAVPRSVVVRSSLLFGPSLIGRPSYFDQQVEALLQRRPVTLFDDEWRTPLDLATAARALAAIARSDFVGLLHVGGPERISRVEMGQRLARWLEADASLIVPASRNSIAGAQPRPRDTSLDSSRCRELFPAMTWPTFEAAIREISAK